MTNIKDTVYYHYSHTKKNLSRLFIRVIQALIAAISAIIIVHSFNLLIKNLQKILIELHAFVPIWTILGAIFVVLVIYRISPRAKYEGGQCYISTVNSLDGRFRLKDTIFKYWAALFTLGTFGNGGIVAPVGRVTAGINSVIEEKLQGIQKFDLKVGAICGFAAAIATIFHAPIAGGFFAVEILEKTNMKYRYLFPALLSSAFAVFFAQKLNLPAFYHFDIPVKMIPTNIYLYVIVIGLITGFTGRLYNIIYQNIARIIKRNEKQHLLLEIIVGSTIVAIISFYINPELMGTSNKLIYQITNDIDGLKSSFPLQMNFIVILFIYLVIKMVGNCITVGVGLSAGFTGPIIIVGMLIGLIFSTIMGIEYYSSEFYALICAGFTGMLASSLNIPIAGMILSIELFGYNYAVVGIISTIIAFKFNDYSTLFDYSMENAEID